jgi:hypothetical protein
LSRKVAASSISAQTAPPSVSTACRRNCAPSSSLTLGEMVLRAPEIFQGAATMPTCCASRLRPGSDCAGLPGADAAACRRGFCGAAPPGAVLRPTAQGVPGGTRGQAQQLRHAGRATAVPGRRLTGRISLTQRRGEAEMRRERPSGFLCVSPVSLRLCVEIILIMGQPPGMTVMP